MHLYTSYTALCALTYTTLTTATLLVDYTAPAAVSNLGTPQLEGASLGAHLDAAAAVGSPAFIQPGTDPDGKAALHFHRNSGDRRAEVEAKGTYAAGKQYFVGYEFRLSNVHEHLAIFQWKKGDKSNGQDIPFNLQFTEVEPTRLSLGYTPGGSPSAKYGTIWTDPSAFDTNKTHNIALAWDTTTGSNANKIQLWFDGVPVFTKTGLDLWTGASYPKFGIYRGESGDHDATGDNDNVFDLFVYRVQVSDASLEEVSAASGIGGAPAGDGTASVGGGPVVTAKSTTLTRKHREARETGS